MTKEIIKTGATIEEATAAALAALGLTEEDDYHVEVVKLPAKKLLGLFGGSPAEVKVTCEAPDAPKAEKQEKRFEKKKDAPKKTAAKKDAPKQEKRPAAPAAAKQPAEKALSFSERRASLSPAEGHEKAVAYLTKLVEGLGVPECTVQAFENDEEILFELSCGDDYGIVIGRRGETLDALQYLVRMVENRGRQGYKRVTLNIGDYREKREAALSELARRDAAKVLRTGRSLTLEPMNPYERRVVHTTVQEIAGVTSYSTGVDLERRVIIACDGTVKPDRTADTRRDRSDRRDRRDRPERRDRRDRPRREPYVPDIAAGREKHSDAASVSLYGKIEVKSAPESTETE